MNGEGSVGGMQMVGDVGEGMVEGGEGLGEEWYVRGMGGGVIGGVGCYGYVGGVG